jgi:TolB protein
MNARRLGLGGIPVARLTRLSLFTALPIALLCLANCHPPTTTSSSVPPTKTRSDGAIRLTVPPIGASDQNPAFSPDGSRLVFTRFDEGYNDGPASIFLFDLDNGRITRLTPVEDQDNVNLPGAAWDANSNRIVFASDRLEADDLWRVAPDGSGLSRITNHSGPPWYIEPSWSPDGQWIVFEADNDVPDDRQRGSIWKVRADGTGLTQLTTGPGAGTDDRQPNWSPGGDRILFQRRTSGGDDWDLYTMAADSGDHRQLTTAPSSDTDASWAPNGACVVYSSDHGGLSLPGLFVIFADGGKPARITFSDTYEDSAPSWSPDGNWIAFESREGQVKDSPANLWRIAVPEGMCDGTGVGSQLPAATGDQPASDLSGIDDFLYQLQNLDLEAIGDTAYDLVIIDYSAEGDDATAFTATQIAGLKHGLKASGNPGEQKTVLAYMSIGEAEDYRFYWQKDWEPGAPPWLDRENRAWKGNFKVHYWDPAWQSIIYAYTDRLLAAGFDGAYLDIIDAYEYYADQGRATAAQEMASFVATIRAYAQTRDPDFLIFVQNAPELAALVPSYLTSVDGIGQEDIYYGYGDDDQMTPPEVTAELEGYLDLFKAAGRLVLTVDYATTQTHLADAYARSRARGYVPFVTVRDLDRLTINPGHEPD